MQEVRISATEGIAGHVVQTGKILNIKDAYSHPLFYRGVDESTGFRTRYNHTLRLSRALEGYPGGCKAVQGSPSLPRALHGCPGLRKGSARLSRALRNSPRLSRALQGFAWLSKALRRYPDCCIVSQASVRHISFLDTCIIFCICNNRS